MNSTLLLLTDKWVWSYMWAGQLAIVIHLHAECLLFAELDQCIQPVGRWNL